MTQTQTFASPERDRLARGLIAGCSGLRLIAANLFGPDRAIARLAECGGSRKLCRIPGRRALPTSQPITESDDHERCNSLIVRC
jgi:hypothetical protein